MARSHKDICKFPSCDNEVSYPILGVCSTCYAGLRLWMGRSVARKRHRAQQYDRMRERMDYMMDGRDLLPGYTKKRTKANEELVNARRKALERGRK